MDIRDESAIGSEYYILQSKNHGAGAAEKTEQGHQVSNRHRIPQGQDPPRTGPGPKKSGGHQGLEGAGGQNQEQNQE